MTFEVGDKVIYPNHGLGTVERIENRTIMGETCGFYSLRMVDSDTVVLVPLDNVDGVGLRRAIDDREVKKLFTLLGNGKIDNHQNWKGRFKDNSDKMRTGSIYDVVDVLKSLTFLAKSKNLSFREKRMLDRAKFLVVSEISEVIGDTAAAIDLKVNKALDRCFTNRDRALAKAKAAKKTAKTVKAKTAKTVKAKTAKTVKAKTAKTVKAKTAKTVKAKTTKTVKAKTTKTVKAKTTKTAKAKTSTTRQTRAARAS